MSLRRIGAKCPRCIKGQIVYFHTDDYPACFQCGYEPPPKNLAEVLRDFDVKTCKRCMCLLRAGNTAAYCTGCTRGALAPCLVCGGPLGRNNTTGSCRDCFLRQARGGAYSEESRAGAQKPRRSSEPELVAWGKPRGDIGLD